MLKGKVWILEVHIFVKIQNIFVNIQQIFVKIQNIFVNIQHHLVSHCEIDPEVAIAEAKWKRLVERVLQVEIDYRVPPPMV